MTFTMTLTCHGCGATQTVTVDHEPAHFASEFMLGWARLLVPREGGQFSVGHEVCPACAARFTPTAKVTKVTG